MFRSLPATICLFALTATLQCTQVNAYCSKCAKIEEERAKEQAEHPQPVKYYDDQVGLHRKEDRTIALAEISKESSLQNETEASKASQSLPDNLQKASEKFFKEEKMIKQMNTNFTESKVNSGETNKRTPSLNQQSYSIISTILKTKHLLETLDGSFTLFIPTNEALQKMPQETLQNLSKPENTEKLALLISNHVVATKILKKDFETHHDKEIKALSGRNLTLKSEDGNLSIEGAHIIRIEPAGYDGVIYIIDQVLQ